MVKIQVSYRVKSKAQRVYKFFKPKEVVQGEKFDLELTFRNLGERFHGGFYELAFYYSDKVIKPQGTKEILPMDKEQSRTIKIENLVMQSSGNCGLIFRNQHYHTVSRDTVSENYLWDSKNNRLGEKSWLDLYVASKEEIYQKYSLVVALIAFLVSIVALLIALIDVIVSFTM